jgi:uncharacterized membrane protein YgcG
MRTTTRILTAAAVVGTVLALAGAPLGASATPAAHDATPPRAAAAIGVHGDTSDFTFDSFAGVYELGRDADRHSTLRVTETLVAEFPDFDQNHGIVRDIPSSYDGHPVHLHVVSVTDGAGTKRDYSSGTTNVDGADFLELKIGDPGGISRYVHGRQQFQIVYTADDVTKHFSDTGDDEFYWDVNGTGWDQPFASVTAKVALDASLGSGYNGTTFCYQGPSGSTQSCPISGTPGNGFSAAAENLGPRENMTVAIGFATGTFAKPAFNLLDYVPLNVILGVGGVLASLVLALIFRFVIWRPRSGDPIIAQYEPPAGVSAMLAANVVGATKRGMAASIVDLAVRRKLRMVERPGGGWVKSEAYGVQQLDASGLLPDEQAVMDALFGASGTWGAPAAPGIQAAAVPPGLQVAAPAAAPADPPPPAGSVPRPGAAPAPEPVSEVRWLQNRDVVLGQAVRRIIKQVDAEAIATGVRRGRPHGILLLVAVLGLGGLAALFLPTVAGGDGNAGAIFAFIVGLWIEIAVLGMVGRIKPLTAAGSKLWDRLEGLKLYIRLAEADRLRMLQSVTGADRIDTADGTQIVKLYERLLPYAVLFGLEGEWAAELAKYYRDAPPDWYDGDIGTFSAIGFASAIGSFSSSAASSLSGSASSSSSGGSGGGGFSGGGGGGGGGGGF